MHYTARVLAAVSACVSAWLSSAAAAVEPTQQQQPQPPASDSPF